MNFLYKFHKKQSGSATVLSIAIISVMSFFTFSIIILTNIISIKYKTQKAADISALAGSQRLIYGYNNVCEFSKKIAELNNVNMEICTKISDYKIKVIIYKKSIFGFNIKSRATATK